MESQRTRDNNKNLPQLEPSSLKSEHFVILDRLCLLLDYQTRRPYIICLCHEVQIRGEW